MEDQLKSTCDISSKRWLSEKELLTYLPICRDSIRKARQQMELPYMEIMGKIMYDRPLVDAWVIKNAKWIGVSKKR